MQLPGQAGKLLQRGIHVVQRVGDGSAEGVHRLHIVIHKIRRVLQQDLGAVPGGVRGGADACQPGGDVVAAIFRVADGPVHQTVQRVQLCPQLFQRVGTGIQRQIGLRLAHDAAHVLAAVDRAAVGAAGQIAGLAPRHAAHIVAHMRVAHGAAVGAALDHAAGIARHAAGVCIAVQDGEVILLSAVGQLRQSVAGGQRLQVHGVLLFGQVDPRGIFAFQQYAQVPPGDAAGAVFTLDRSAYGAAGNLTALRVPARDAAHGGVALHGAREGAVPDRAAVDAGNAAHGGVAAPGCHRSGNMEFLDHRALLQVAEKAHIGPAGADTHAGDGVPLPAEGAAEGGDGCELPASQIQVRRQRHGLSLGPGVQRAVFREVQQVLHGGDGDLVGGRGPGGRHGRAGQQPDRQQQCGEFMDLPFHAVPPLFRLCGPQAAPASPGTVWNPPPRRR